MMAQQVQQMQQSQQQQPVADPDPFAKFKVLVPRLKDSLSKLMEVAAVAFYHNSQSDNCMRPNDSSVERFDKCLEEFYGICDQMELFLRLAQECMSLSQDSAKYTPGPVHTNTQHPQPHPPDAQSFSQYLHIVKTQINCAKDIHDMLSDCAKRLTDQRALSSSGQQAAAGGGGQQQQQAAS